MKKSTFRSFVLVLLAVSTVSCAKESIEEEVNSYNHTAEEKLHFDYSEIENTILKLVNEHRKTLDLKPLQPIAEISFEAEGHNYYMHKENIEGNHSHFGVSVVDDANGRNYFTNIFIRK